VSQTGASSNRLGRTLTSDPQLPAEPSWPIGPVAGPIVGIDLGLRTGIAVLAEVGGVGLRLRRYASTHYANRSALRRGVAGVLADLPPRPHLVVEGDLALARIWAAAARRAGGSLSVVATERWREVLLLPRERRSGTDAKRHAGVKARAVIDWSRRDAGADGPPPPVGVLRHDTAEAILIAVWGALQVGALDPADLPFAVPRVQ
jgi:hypothetical protein